MDMHKRLFLEVSGGMKYRASTRKSYNRSYTNSKKSAIELLISEIRYIYKAVKPPLFSR